MKKSILLISLSVFILSCNSTKTSLNSPHKTYAELSIAQGGTWNGQKYENGTSFKNVDELWVPKSHTDHSFYIRYEGPGWESSKIGYRFYLDWRNAIDIYGKVTDSLILHKVGQDGFESYHHPQSWGMDILKVGDGLGIGALGRYLNNEVLHFNVVDSTYAKVQNSAKSSSVTVRYFGWKTGTDKIDLNSVLTIKSDSRVTQHTFQTPEATEGICTGIVNHHVDYITGKEEGKEWEYIATYGVQTLVPDQLGMALFYQKSDVEKVFEGKDDYLVLFKPTTEKVTFYFLGAWEQEPNGIKNKAKFIQYLNDLLAILNKKNKL